MAIDTSSERFPVLVVDDSAVARKLVEQALCDHDYDITFAKTGAEALQTFAECRPGLVITDWLMPDLTGVELCRRLRRDYTGQFIYIILVTSIAEKSKVVAGLKSGADDYLTKPFDADELLARTEVGRRIIGLQREIEAKNRLLEQLALTDPLTGLPNRRSIEQWAPHQLSGAIRHGFPFWLVASDLDQFKVVNDTYGHDAGDTVLKKFADILKANTRQCDICGRVGGDEFLIIITHGRPAGINIAVNRIRHQIEAQFFQFEGQRARVTASFGIAGFKTGDAADFSRLVVQADVALYEAKRSGGNAVRVSGLGDMALTPVQLQSSGGEHGS